MLTETRREDSQESPKLSQTVLSDLRSGNLKSTVGRDLRGIYDFYLDADSRGRLAGMGRVKRWFFLTAWLLKSMILKLTPARRLLLLVAMLLFVFGVGNQGPQFRLGFLVLLVILMLELKDKLLAHDELATGRAVQAALLPARSPRLEGYEVWLMTRPANEIGGDLADWLKLGPERLGVALGDVAGKGLGAALYMAKLQATLRALAPGQQDLAKLGREVNTIFCRDGLANRFASLVYLELAADSGQVRLLNAGHLPPVVLRGEEVYPLARGGPALGIMCGSSYVQQSVELGPGDLLVVYSDGLTEARNLEGEFYGEERLRELLPRLAGLSAEAAGARLLRENSRFVGQALPSDDLSLVLIKRTS